MYDVRYEIDGWILFWCRLRTDGTDPGPLAQLRRRAVATCRDGLDLGRLAAHPTVSAVRRLFRVAGCDPTRYRPSSEALARRVLKGGDLPAIHPLVDLNNVLSLELLVPCCVIAPGSVEGPLTLRIGGHDEAYESLRGRFSLTGKPVLADRQGPFGTPIADARRVEVTRDAREADLVAYLPAGVVSAAEAERRLGRLVAAGEGITRPPSP